MKERDLVELSRVSIEVLSAEGANSAAVRSAADTLIRAVRPAALVERARKEAADDHSLIHGHSLVAIWSAMETMAIDLVEVWLQRRGPVGAAPRPTRWGVNRFEQLLDPVGLSGPCDSVLARNLFEIQQVRHVFAHKRGRADASFVKACPYLGYKINDQIVIGRDAWADVVVNALLYTETVLRRMKQHLGVPLAGRAMPAKPIRLGPDSRSRQPPRTPFQNATSRAPRVRSARSSESNR